MINNRSSTLLSKFIEKYITLKWGMKLVYSRLWYKCWWCLPMDDLLMSKCWIQADVPYSKIVPLFLKHSKLIFFTFLCIWYVWNCLFKFFPLELDKWFWNVYNSHKTQFQIPVCIFKNTGVKLKDIFSQTYPKTTMQFLELRRWNHQLLFSSCQLYCPFHYICISDYM